MGSGPRCSKQLRKAGIRNYTIFRHGLTPFGYFEADDLEGTLKYLARDGTNRRWSESLAPLIEVETDPRTDPPYLLPRQWHMG